jgi:hypothetical protein
VTYAIPALVLLIACAVSGTGDPATLTVGAVVRLLFDLGPAAAVRRLYLRNHEGELDSPETLWIAAAFATIIGVGRLA